MMADFSCWLTMARMMCKQHMLVVMAINPNRCWLSSLPRSASMSGSIRSPATSMTDSMMAKPPAGIRSMVLRMPGRSSDGKRDKKRIMALGTPSTAKELKIIPQDVRIRISPHCSSAPSNARGKTTMVLTAPKTSPAPIAKEAHPDCLAMTPISEIIRYGV